MKTLKLKDGFLTLADTDAICPNCATTVLYNEKELQKSYLIYKICKGCRKKVGITADMKGDTVIWLKSEEKAF